jgi:hypothetical protein
MYPEPLTLFDTSFSLRSEESFGTYTVHYLAPEIEDLGDGKYVVAEVVSQYDAECDVPKDSQK